MNTTLSELQQTDTTTLNKALSRLEHYTHFITQRVNDTISKDEADQLQMFISSGKNLQAYAQNRQTLMKTLEKNLTQLNHLSEDALSKKKNAEELGFFLGKERTLASDLLPKVKAQQAMFHTSLQSFKNAHREVEKLIRQHNNGLLPTIIRDTLSF